MSALHIIDADGHIREDVSEIQEYLDPPFAGRKFFFPLWPGNGRFRGCADSFDSSEVMAGLYGRGRDREGCVLPNPRSIPWTDSISGLGLPLARAYNSGCTTAS